ncbi:hypothetical protein [Frankia sp. R82]|uniref:hypothetical protein n=1 Tax=Frankia sp. R82 TaxID=2950553 RepID=UPI0020441688|nr:hypothetical protein [Frankia sp. R82]MCM3885044.1 hypothetical protein [Frankia sp. R82]
MGDIARRDTIPHTSASTSSTPPDASPPADSTAELGERILAELGADRTSNTLTRWLAHHTARLVEAADRARETGAADADAKAAEAREAILQLWKARDTWPEGWPPPRAAKIAEILDSLPDLDEDQCSWQRKTTLAQLQELHYRTLAGLVDLVAGSDTAGIEQQWLDTVGDRLTPQEFSLLQRAVTERNHTEKFIPQWLRELEEKIDLKPIQLDLDEISTHPLANLGKSYLEKILAIIEQATSYTTDNESPGDIDELDRDVDGTKKSDAP